MLTSLDDNRKNVGGNGNNIGGSHFLEPDAMVELLLSFGEAPPLASDRPKFVAELVGASKSGIKLVETNGLKSTL